MLFLKALNSVIRIPPTHPTMQPSTQVMVAHVDTTPGTAARCPPYAHMPPNGHCIAPLHLTLMVISTKHVESLFYEKNSCPHPPQLPLPRLDGKRGARFIHWRSMHIMGLLSRHEQARRRRKHFLPTALLCQSFFREP